MALVSAPGECTKNHVFLTLGVVQNPVGTYKYLKYQAWVLLIGAVTGEPTANAALQCTIIVSGFVPNTNQEVAVASFTFTPPPSPVAQVPILHSILPSSFSNGLNNVTIIQDNKLAVLLVDNLVGLARRLIPFPQPFSTYPRMAMLTLNVQ